LKASKVVPKQLKTSSMDRALTFGRDRFHHSADLISSMPLVYLHDHCLELLWLLL